MQISVREGNGCIIYENEYITVSEKLKLKKRWKEKELKIL